jgi:crossover junction endodeoxyribonuclease RuvC
VALHTPTEVKAAVTGNGQADKVAVTKMVTKILRLETAPKPADAADALALAITHAWRRGVGLQGAAASGAAVTPAQRIWAEAEARARRR